MLSFATLHREWLSNRRGDILAGIVALASIPEAIGLPIVAGLGACGHSPTRTMIVGSTTTAKMRTCQLPVLLFR